MCMNCNQDHAVEEVGTVTYENKQQYATATEKAQIERDSPLFNELERLHTLFMILENTFESHHIKLQPVMQEQPKSEGKDSDQVYNPIWDTEAGQRLRHLGVRIEQLTDRVSYTTRATQV